MTTKRSIKRAQVAPATEPTAIEGTHEGMPQPAFSGLQVVLVLDGQQAGGWRVPLSETYAETEQAVTGLAGNITSTLARLYDDRARRIAAAEKQRADGLAEELRKLREQMEGKTT